ncbi:MAG: type IV fimbrial bioproteinis protein FimT [Comamonadaceae bacterium]|nr:MAG: type IV fimbrial bioproteinis protein FimT [Comamonadaceae bacterium]
MKLHQTDPSLLHSKPHGFTLIEVMVSLAILGLLAALGAPSFSDSIRRFRVKGISDDLMASIQLARVEAIRRGRPVALIRELASSSCSNPLLDSDTWSCGWRIVEDTNANGSISAAERNNPIQTTTVPRGYGVVHPGLGNQMVFGVWGQAVGVGQRFVITNTADGIGGVATLTICLNAGNRLRTIKEESTCL